MLVLVVDDDPNLRSLYARALREAGLGAETVADAASAIVRLSRNPPDLVLLDLRLGRDHGLDVAQEVTRRGLPTRIVVVSGTAEYTREALLAMSPAIVGVLRKPVDIEVLVCAVRRALSDDRETLRAAARLSG